MFSPPASENEKFWSASFMRQAKGTPHYDRELWWLLLQLGLACILKSSAITRLEETGHGPAAFYDSSRCQESARSVPVTRPDAEEEREQKEFFEQQALFTRKDRPEVSDCLKTIAVWCGLKERLLRDLREVREKRGLVPQTRVQ